MYTEKIQKLENEILELKKYIKANKKEIKKREKILSMVVDEELEMEIQIYKEDDGNWYIDVTKDGNTEKYLFLWSGTMGVSICPLNREEDSNNIRLFRGKIDKFNSKKFVVKVREDKIWNYEYIVITLYRKPIKN